MSASLNRNAYMSSLMAKATITPSRNSSASSLIKTICLHDWWLVKSKDESKIGLLRVSGIGSTDGQSRRVFHSAAISKRCDQVTLETVDGIVITLSGFINRSATQDNGFSVEVCNCFQFGFPHNWKDYASFDESNTNPSAESELWPLPMSLDDIPVSMIRDILVPDRGRGGGGGSSIQMKLIKSVVDDLLQINVTQREEASNLHNEVSRNTVRMKSGVVTRSMSKQNRRPEKNAFENNVTQSESEEEASKVQNQDSRHNVRKKKTADTSKQNGPEEKRPRLVDNVAVSDSKRCGNALNKDGVEVEPSVRRSSRRIKAAASCNM